MRLFLAINLPEEIKKELFEISQGLKRFGKLKLVEKENIHITLKFLGDCEADDVTPRLEEINVEPFEISLRDLAAFPSVRRPRVLWAGCDKGFDEIFTLQKRVEESLPKFPKDTKFHPHATVARVKFLQEKTSLQDFLKENEGKKIGAFRADSFELMESGLGRDGPEYRIVKSFPFN